MELNEIIADLDSFLAENQVKTPTVAVAAPVQKTKDNSEELAREVIGAVLSSVDESVRPDVLANRLLEATMVIQEDEDTQNTVFDKIADFFESVGKSARRFQDMIQEACAAHDDYDDHDDHDDDADPEDDK